MKKSCNKRILNEEIPALGSLIVLEVNEFEKNFIILTKNYIRNKLIPENKDLFSGLKPTPLEIHSNLNEIIDSTDQFLIKLESKK